ncbi:organic cation transporter protein [Nephila pilipes]|uniref:Organic cation transporter protein n=1 Tax=Nephila pilipes TaxID=299642 RepID=A0A8X6QIQ7_NEPPI|nr:organic cation transporter protein [Nephila pilipes]
MDMFEVIGSFGPWQRKVFIIFFIINIVGMWQNLATTFFAPNMDFRCVDSVSRNDNGTTFDNSCEVQVGNRSFPCTKWEYDTSFYSQTIVSEWDLVCDREWLISLSKSVYMGGFLVSVIFFGQLSDSIGRLPAVVISYIITVVSMLMTLLSTSYVMFMILRFLQAFGRTALSTVGYVLVMELVGPRHRTDVGIAIQLGWSIGFASLSAVGWFFRHWFWFQLALFVPILPFFFTYHLVPESPRWLLTKGKKKRFEKLVEKAARINGKEIKGSVQHLMQNKSEEGSQKTLTLLYILKWPKMRNRVLNSNYVWFVNSFMYYGLSFNTNDLAGNPYLNLFLAGALEFPSYAFLFWSIKKWGRRLTLIFLMVVGGAACASIVAVPDGEHSWITQSRFWLTAQINKMLVGLRIDKLIEDDEMAF